MLGHGDPAGRQRRAGLAVRPHSIGLDRAVWKALVVGGLPLLVLAAFNLIYGTVDVPILDYIAGSTQVGWYSLAYQWVGIPIFISTAVVMAFFPRLSALGKSRSPQFAVAGEPGDPLHGARSPCLPPSDSASSPRTCSGSSTREDFSESVVLMQILAIHIPVAAVDTIMAMALIAVDRQNRYVVVAGCAAVLNPIACVIAINLTLDRVRQRRDRCRHRHRRH